MRDIVPELYDGSYFREDLARLPQHVADIIMQLLVQIDETKDAGWELLANPKGEHINPSFNAKPIRWLQDRGFNLYRLRPLFNAASPYRIIYAYDVEHNEFICLAIIKKKIPGTVQQGDVYDYERDHPITRRICDEYEQLGIPKIH